MKHSHDIHGAILTNDERRILSWSKDGTVKLWEAETGEQIGPTMKHDGPVNGVRLTKNGERILSWSGVYNSGEVRMWDVQTGQGSGTSLIQDLRAKNIAVIGITPQGDKLTRAAKVSAKFEAGAVFFPKAAPWLGPLKAELLGFPNVKHDDQVDLITQALSWINRYRQSRIPFALPIIVSRPRRYFGDIPPNF